MPPLSHSQKEALKRTICVMLVRGSSAVDEQPFYSYVAVPGERLEAFKKALDGSGNTAFQAQDYGKVLHWDYGEPSEDIMAYMEAEYGVNHADMMVVPGPEDNI